MPTEQVDPSRYETHLDIKYAHLSVIDIPALAAAVRIS